MKSSEQESLIEESPHPADATAFHAAVFSAVHEKAAADIDEKESPFTHLFSSEWIEISNELDFSEVQSSCSVRNVICARTLAKHLISDEGALNPERVEQAAGALDKHLYSLGPGRELDSPRKNQILAVLKALSEKKELVSALRRIGKPHMHAHADQIIRDTLLISEKSAITDAHARQAALSALFCYLRQSVGSCFATAPSIIVHDEQPLQFLTDIQEILSTGRLKRTFGGVEYAVPLSYSWGAGDLRRLFVMPVDAPQDQAPLYRSPGILAAFEAVGMIENNHAQKKAREWIEKAVKRLGEGNSYLLTSPEALIRQALLIHRGLTEEEIREYLLKPKETLQSGMMMQVSTQASEKSGKGKDCSLFLKELEQAYTAFKTLSENALLKSWEFTLASFAETKTQFTRWNLYSSLGFDPEQPGGLGACLYGIVKRRLEECNRDVERLQEEYEVSYQQLMFMQGRVRNVGSEQEARWVRAEYQSKLNEFQTLEEVRDQTNRKAHRYAHLINDLIELYDSLFPKYFQEIYDPEMHEVAATPYDDSPAGFRLLYKYGRSNTSQWSLIHNHVEFVDALANFFIATETDLANSAVMDGLQDDLAEITTSVVSHVRSEEFIETAFHRMAQAHQKQPVKDPLENLDKIEKKPWAYTSGGAITTLLSCYFKLGDKPSEVSRWVESPMELMVFLIDTLKQMPDKESGLFEKKTNRSMLIHSPTHAFLLKPGLELFRKGWQSKEFTYTWARDEVVKPMQQFVQNLFLHEEQIELLLSRLKERIPKQFRPIFTEAFARMGGSMQIQGLRHHIVDTIDLTRGLQYMGQNVLSAEEVDSIIFESVPLFPVYKFRERVEVVLGELSGLSEGQKERALNLLEKGLEKRAAAPAATALDLKKAVLALLALTLGQTSVSCNYPLEVARAMQKHGFAMPRPFLFGDTNWLKEMFGFVVNPGNRQLELWRLNESGSAGAPMRDWDRWLNGTRKHPDWGVFNRPYEYVSG